MHSLRVKHSEINTVGRSHKKQCATFSVRSSILALNKHQNLASTTDEWKDEK